MVCPQAGWLFIFWVTRYPSCQQDTTDCVSAADGGRALSAPVCAEKTILEEGPLVGIPTYRIVPPFDSFSNGNFTFRGDF